MHFGFMKVPFGFEETTSSSKLKTVERSTMNRFFINQLGYGARHTGIYLNGDFGEMEDILDGVYYALAITGTSQGHVDGPSNSPASWGRLGFTSSYEAVDFNVGFNMGYIPCNRCGGVAGKDINLGNYTNIPENRKTSDYVYGLYANVNWEGFSLMSEFMAASLTSGSLAGGHASPVGFTLMPSYRFDAEDFGDFEIVGSYSYLSSNGFGIDPLAVMPGSALSVSSPKAIERFAKMDSFYLGGTWFIVGNDVTLTSGFEYTRLDDQLRGDNKGPKAPKRNNTFGFRTRLQLLF